MKTQTLRSIGIAALVLALSSTLATEAFAGGPWQVLVNNGQVVPGDTREFNSYSQPSLSQDGYVVFRARSRAGSGGEPAHGIFAIDTSLSAPVSLVFDRTILVPGPNNLGTQFIEPPAFPRIDMHSHTMASRGDHQPAWEYLLPGGTETRAGTTGIYTNPYGSLIAGASNLGAVPDFPFYSVPGLAGVKFDVFPGAPAVTDGSTIAFKGNYTVPDPVNPGETITKTGVYYRDLLESPTGGTAPVVLIANSDMLIPGSSTLFGSTAPPSAAGRLAVFVGLDIEEAPTLGGIYLALLQGSSPPLTPLVQIGGQVPGEAQGVGFALLGEGLSFDGRFLGFWAAWGAETRQITLQCPTDGNPDLIAYCNQTYPAGYTTTVPVRQGMFVHDVLTGITTAVAKAPNNFDDFLYWNFSGDVPGSKEEGEPARWRSAAFVAVSGAADENPTDGKFTAIFKATSGVASEPAAPITGLYLRKAPGDFPFGIMVQTGMDGTLIDPQAIDPDTQMPLPVTAVGIEREGLRGTRLALTVSMGSEEAGWAGIYMTTPPTLVQPLQPAAVVSRKMHGGAGEFDIPLPLSGPPGIDCRRGSGLGNNSHQLVATFSVPVALSGASINTGIGAVESVSAVGTEVIVNLSGVADAQRLTVTLTNVSDGNTINDINIPVAFLLGDTNGTSAVNASDIGQVKSVSGASVTPLNFRTDVNTNGNVDASDISMVKSRSGMALPPDPARRQSLR